MLVEMAADTMATTDTMETMAMAITMVGAGTTTGVTARPISEDSHAAIATGTIAIDAVREATKKVLQLKTKARGVQSRAFSIS